jgi:carbon monoxide dehydrogenase subunit G
MLEFEGDRTISQPPAEVWARLGDARFLVECMPDREAVKEAAADQAVCTIRPGFAFVRGRLEVTVRILERAENFVRVSLHSKGVGTSSDVEATLTLAPQDGGTKLHYKAAVTHLGGLLKAVPGGLIRGAGQKVIGDVLTGVEKKLAEPKA